jgi:hypothetical protein
MSGHHQYRRSRSISVSSYSPPMPSQMARHPRHVQEHMMQENKWRLAEQENQRRLIAEQDRATAKQMLWERARWDIDFARKIRDPVYYAAKLREQIYVVERDRLQPVRLPLSQSFLNN